jgi:beta-galactosidase
MPNNEYLDWNVVFAPGVLSARGYNGRKVVVQTKIETAGPPAGIRLRADRSTITADGEDLSIIDVSVVDPRGGVVANANNLIQFELKGAGKIIGVGNGDPSSHESDKASERRVFNGFAQIIVQASRREGTIELTATSPKLTPARLKIKSQADKLTPAVLP